jgi:tetratricopeptide (TPR) repeat protein
LAKKNLLDELEVRFRELEKALKAAKSQAESIKLISSIAQLSKGIRDLEHSAGEFKERLRMLIAQNQWLSGDPDERITALDASAPPLRSDRLNSSTYAQQGWNCIAVGDYEGAKDKLIRALELAPDDMETLSMLGWAQTMMLDYDAALMTFHKVLGANPSDALARVNLGFICMKKGIYGEAVEHLSKATRNGSDRKAVLYANYYLGQVYQAREMYDDAESYFEKTIELGPNMCEAHFQLGRTRYLHGRRADAISAWRHGVAANCYSPWSERCREAVHAVEVGETPDLD